MREKLLCHLLRGLEVVDGVWVDVGEVIVETHTELDATVSQYDLGGRESSELHFCELIVLLQDIANVFEDWSYGCFRKRQYKSQQVQQRTIFVVLCEDGDCSFGVVEGHVVHPKEMRINFPIEFALPKIYPLLYAVAGLLGIERLFPHTYQL